MPVVPFNPKTDDAPAQRDPPPEGFALMAAAQMHKEGRLVQPQRFSDFRRSDDIEDRRKDHQSAEELMEGISVGGVYDPEPTPKNSNLSKKLGGAKLDAALLAKAEANNAN